MGRPVDGEFQARVDDKGAPLSGFVSAVQAACNPKGGSEPVHRFPTKFKEYFVDVLRRMLVDRRRRKSFCGANKTVKLLGVRKFSFAGRDADDAAMGRLRGEGG